MNKNKFQTNKQSQLQDLVLKVYYFDIFLFLFCKKIIEFFY